MFTLQDLARRFTAIRDSGDVGVPVALRIHARVPADVALQNLLTDALAIGSEIFQCETFAARTLGTPAGGHATHLATHRGGQTTLVTVAGGEGFHRLDALLIGNRGIARLEGGEAVRFDAP